MVWCLLYGVDSRAAEQCHSLQDQQTIPFDFTNTTWQLESPLIPDNAIIGHIETRRLPIFNTDDPSENIWLFRTANRLHLDSKDRTIRLTLLFKSGDNYQPRLLSESARLLRNKVYLYDAQVFPVRVCGNQVDIIVVTRDMWTLSPGIDISRSGGSNSSSVFLRDTNFLGLGKRVTLARRNFVDRKGWTGDYGDSNLLGTRLVLDLLYADYDDGERQKATLSRPFYSLDSRWAFAMQADQGDQIDKLYLRGNSIAEFRTQQHNHSIAAGLSSGWYGKKTQRWWLGFSWLEERFFEKPGNSAPVNFPINRQINYLWFNTQSIKDEFVTLHNINQIYRTEDINLGYRWSATLGWADTAWGSDQDRLVYRFSYRNIWKFNAHQLLAYSTALSGFWQVENDASEDALFSNRWRYYHLMGRQRAYYVSLLHSVSRGLPNNKQILMGGAADLRGYPLRYQAGDRRILLTLEKRYYSDIQWFKLFYAGAAVFFDVGRAWFSSQENSGSTGPLSDVGFGLRLSSNRAEKSRILHIDLAFPLQREQDVDSFQFLLTGKASF